MKRLTPLDKILLVGVWERYSYFSLRALLVLYFIEQLGRSDQDAYMVYGLFAALTTGGPLVGGLLADRWFGSRKLVVVGAWVMTLAHGLLWFGTDRPSFLILGLSLLCVGSSLFKGNLTSLLGSYLSSSVSMESARAFSLFYVSINVGSILACVGSGYLVQFVGWHAGFSAAGLGMTASLAVLMRNPTLLEKYGSPPSQAPNASWLYLGVGATTLLCCGLLVRPQQASWLLEILLVAALIVSARIVKSVQGADRCAAVRVMIGTLFLSFYFGFEVLCWSVINVFTYRFVDNQVFGFSIPAIASQALNPLAVIIVGLVVSGQDLKRGFFVGWTLMTACFLLLYSGCLWGTGSNSVPYSFLALALTTMGCGEVFVTPRIYAAINNSLPANIRSTMQGLTCFALAYSYRIGSGLGGLLFPIDEGSANLKSLLSYQQGFAMIGALCACVGCLWLLHTVVASEERNWVRKQT